MPNRSRWDAMANPKSVKEYGVLAADAIAVGDLCWIDKRTGTVKSFAHADAWTGSTAGSQGKVAENFVGVAMSAHAANDGANLTVRVAGKGVFGYPVTTAATFEVGDYITASKDPSGNLLFAQAVDKGALGDPGEPSGLTREICIGKAAKRYLVAASVIEVDIQGMREAGSGPRMYLTS
jgi:hypothetical protein